MNRSKKVVVVEDNPDLLFLLGKILVKAGLDVECFRDGSSIMDNKLNRWPDLFILDKELGYMDGFVICKFLKSKRETAAIPIVMISGTKESEGTALKIGVSYFYEKPIDIDKLLEVIRFLMADPTIRSFSPEGNERPLYRENISRNTMKNLEQIYHTISAP
jgi:DNA-binding response OmpR family regulator